MSSSVNAFTDKATLYSKYRPGYAIEFIRYLYAKAGFNAESCIADIGSGTGIFSKLLLEQNSTVYAVEPNCSMRIIAEQALFVFNKFHSVIATGEMTSLPDKSIDHITVVQAFHWLDADLFKAECKRILKPEGKIAVVYNRKKKDSLINRQQADLVKVYYPSHYDIINHWNLREDPVKNFFDNGFEFVAFENDIINNIEEFVGRILSASFSKEDERFISRVKDIFNEHEREGIVRIPNDTIAYIGSIH